ncbi:MAG: sensor histidine kinase [Bacteroidia bacterium]
MRNCILILLLLFAAPIYGQQVNLDFKGEKKLIIEDLKIARDAQGSYRVQDFFLHADSIQSEQAKLNLDHTDEIIWTWFDLTNLNADSNLCIRIDHPLLDSISLFYYDQDSNLIQKNCFLNQAFSERVFPSVMIVLPFHLASNHSNRFVLRIRSSEQMILPIQLDRVEAVRSYSNYRDMIYGIFVGIVLVMLFYNLFIYFSTKETSYLYYVVYIFFIGISQITLSGHTHQFFFENSGDIYKYTIVFFPALSGVFAVLFLRNFMQTSLYAPWQDKVILGVLGGYIAAALTRISGMYHVSSVLMDVMGAFGGIFVYYTTVVIYRKGQRSAGFFMIAWTLFILGILSFVLRNLNVLPFNVFTSFGMPAGAASEIILLSFALADRINTLQKQKREKEEEAYQAALENQRIIREQNIILEGKVKERTHELTESNHQLNLTLKELKDTQSQLVDQEKMASLGQLTAGIAHEINNPINFVTSNINPLRRDVKMLLDLYHEVEQLAKQSSDPKTNQQKINDLKEDLDFDYLLVEIQHLLKGIDDGANRTAEIVKGLKIFSRTDEDSIKKADIVEGIESTLIILNNQLNKIEIEKDYATERIIDCYPGKLNQVFLNFLSNSIYAIKSKFGTEQGGKITIRTKEVGEEIFIYFGDNGIGIPEEIQSKLFDPFFTTKPVGEGTGLGLSIAYQTVSKHGGKLSVSSKLNEGALFEISLPVNQKD